MSDERVSIFPDEELFVYKHLENPGVWPDKGDDLVPDGVVITRVLVDISLLYTTTTTGRDAVLRTMMMNERARERRVVQRVALYAPADSYGFAIGRMVENGASGFDHVEMRTFTDRMSATRWLDLCHSDAHYFQKMDASAP